MNYQQLKDIIEQLELFEESVKTENFSLVDFAQWIINHEKVAENNTEHQTNAFNIQPINVKISILVGRMSKYARIYSKQILHDHLLSGLDDYTFMSTLMFRESMTKTELIQYNLMDSITSGVDIIKRLLKLNYIEEFDDENDKRSKRVKITETGQKMMISIHNAMQPVSEVISGNLSVSEKQNLLASLLKLEAFHNTIYLNDRKSDIKQIADTYLETQNTEGEEYC